MAKLQLVIGLILMSRTIFASERVGLLIELEIRGNQEYRVVLVGDDVNSTVKFYKDLFLYSSDGFAPWGALVKIRNHEGEIIACENHNEVGYTSAEWVSNLLLDSGEHSHLSKGEYFYSPWYKVSSLVFRFDTCVDSRRAAWKEFQIRFKVKTAAGMSSVVSEWNVFNEDVLNDI